MASVSLNVATDRYLGVARESDLLLGQLIAVANESFREEIGALPKELMEELENRARIILGL